LGAQLIGGLERPWRKAVKQTQGKGNRSAATGEYATSAVKLVRDEPVRDVTSTPFSVNVPPPAPNASR
jgi:hypothetical protein